MNEEEGKSVWYLRNGPEITPCSEEELRATGTHEWDFEWHKKSAVCINDEEFSFRSSWLSGNLKTFDFWIAACDHSKRSTCKTREETAAFLKTSTIYLRTIRNVVIDDQFSSDQDDPSHFKGN